MNNAARSQSSQDSDSNGGQRGGIDPAEIRVELEKILASAPFRNSKRYPALLRYVVERALNGASADIKERNIGVDVFGRDPLYDLSADPIVRISAGEVRKRLAQYYQEAASRDKVRIDMPVGSYQPEFTGPIEPAEEASETVATLPQANALREGKAEGQLRGIRRGSAIAGFVLLAVAGGFFIFQSANRPAALNLFWRPVITPGSAITLCVGRGVFFGNDVADSLHAIDRSEDAVAWWDAETLARLAGLTQAKGATLRLFRGDHASFSDLQQSPSILIGAYNDQWTLELMQRMRFTFQRSGDLQWIADRDRPSFRGWKIDLAQKDSRGDLAIAQDYAVISRVMNPRTGFITVTVAGLWGYGTLAAGRFLTEPKYLNEAVRAIPPGWNDRDMQIVIGTEVIRGSSGPPRVLATAFW